MGVQRNGNPPDQRVYRTLPSIARKSHWTTCVLKPTHGPPLPCAPEQVPQRWRHGTWHGMDSSPARSAAHLETSTVPPRGIMNNDNGAFGSRTVGGKPNSQWNFLDAGTLHDRRNLQAREQSLWFSRKSFARPFGNGVLNPHSSHLVAESVRGPPNSKLFSGRTEALLRSVPATVSAYARRDRGPKNAEIHDALSPSNPW